MSPKVFFVPFFVSLFLGASLLVGADEYTERACDRVFHLNTSQLSENRGEDANFIYIDEFCCCKDKILKIFKYRTEEENNRVNPATDKMLVSLGEYEKMIKYAVKQVEDLKQINAMYSFPQTVMVRPDNGYAPPDTNESGEGCEPLDFSNPEDRDKYLAVIDRIENGGLGAGSYSLQNQAGGQAFGRYQLMRATASFYCSRTTPGLNCCANWKSTPQCQDEIFELLTADNTRGMSRRGIPLNTCTLYLAHQQGLGGLYWLFGGKNPYRSISGLQSAVRSNIGQREWQRIVLSGADINNEEVLRKIYLEYWNKKLHGDILNSEGSEYSPEDFAIQTEPFIEYAEKQRSLWREGILLELRKIKTEMERDR